MIRATRAGVSAASIHAVSSSANVTRIGRGLCTHTCVSNDCGAVVALRHYGRQLWRVLPSAILATGRAALSRARDTHVIEFEQLTKQYGDVVAVDRLSLQVQPGEVYALLGANGAGKTTALRCLTTLLRPTAGTARVAGYDVRTTPLAARSRLGFLSASMGLYQRLTAVELLEYFARLHGLEEELLRTRVSDAIRMFEITPFRDQLCGTLSTGQRQRVSIARAVLHDPPVLILDEPTLGLDVLSRRTIVEFIEDARQRERTILFSTHQMDEVELLADRVGVLAGGRLVTEGRIDELVARSGEQNLARAFLRIVTEAE